MIRRGWTAVALAIAIGWVAAPAGAAERDYAGFVNPWVESDRGRFFFFQSASNPFGFVKLRPDTSTQSEWNSGYRPSENVVKGFSHVHEWQLSGIQVMPTSGDPVSKTQGGVPGSRPSTTPRASSPSPATTACGSTATGSAPS